MPGDRLVRILRLLSAAGGSEPRAAQLCEVSARALAVSGAGVMLMSGDTRQGSLCSSNPVSARIEDLQYTLGEGPCMDAYFNDRPVLESNLAAPAVARWPGFTAPALKAGARAVFGFPLRVGRVHLGALNLYCDRPGSLSDDQHADALVMAGVVARTVLSIQAKAATDELPRELVDGSDFHFVVHQAAGMTAAQLDVSVTEALIRLRAHAFARDLTLSDVARDVVGRRLRLD